jgi:thiamine-phosphate pyrophosphorylase
MSTSESSSPQTLRIIDASLNRAAEGLRFLEDSARFLLNDVALTEQLKTLRHTLVISGWPFQKRLIQSRDSEGDVGSSLKVEPGGKDLPLAIVANSRRVQEALRTLEELAKVMGETLPLDADKFQQARFDLYTIEKNLIARLLRQDKSKLVSGLYAVIDTEALKGSNHLVVARQIIKAGTKIIQLRDKTTIKKDLMPIAEDIRHLCKENSVLFIMNDYLDVALAVEADGLHIGQEDLPVKVARKLAPMDMLIGCSVFTAGQAQKAVADGADYVAVGAVFPTPTKETVVVGLERLRLVREAVSVPLVAIGGINKDNAAEVKKTGANSVAVISAILGAASPENAAREIINNFEV